MSARQHCAHPRAVVEARRAAGPFNRTIFAGGAFIRPQPAARQFSIATVSLRVYENSLPVSRTRRHGVFLRRRSAIKHCAPARAGADFAATSHGVSSLFDDPRTSTPLRTPGSGGFSRASGGDWLQPFSFPSYKSAQVFGARRHVFLLAAQIVDQFQPIRIDTHIEAVNLRLHGHGFLRQVRHVQNIWMPHSSVKCPAWDTAGGKSDASDVASFSDLTDVSVHFTLPGINNTGAAMNFKLSTLAAAAALLVNCSAPVMAADTALGTIGHWHLSANDAYCEAVGGYANGTSLSFVINAKGAAMIEIKNANWHIPKGEYPVEVQVDRAASDSVTATARDGWLIFDFHLNEPTLNLLSYGRTMYVTVGRERYQYNLVQSEAMLKALRACAAPLMAAANPFADQPSASAPPANPFAETRSNPYRRM